MSNSLVSESSSCLLSDRIEDLREKNLGLCVFCVSAPAGIRGDTRIAQCTISVSGDCDEGLKPNMLSSDMLSLLCGVKCDPGKEYVGNVGRG